MRTSVSRDLTGTIVIVLWVAMLAGMASSHNREGVHYKPKSLKEHMGTLLGPSEPSITEELIQTDPEEDHNYALQPYMMAIQSIPVDKYRDAMAKARTHYDVFRIFFPTGNYRNEDIDKMMWSLAGQHRGLTGFIDDSGTRISPGIIPAPHSPTTALVHVKNIHFDFSAVNDDVMMADSPACDKCRHLQGSPSFAKSRLTDPHERRLQTDSWQRRKRRHKPSNDRHEFMKWCKKRRKPIAANIKECRKGGNRKRCRTLRSRYQTLRKQCKRDSENQSIIPGGLVVLPDPQKLTTTTVSPKEHGGQRNPPGLGFTEEQWAQWTTTQGETNDHGQCGTPIPQVVRVRDVLGGGDEDYNPSCVLRFRCRTESGCCPQEYQTCAATASEEVPKTVLVTKIRGEANIEAQVHYSNLTMSTFLVTNDTRCGCIDVLPPNSSVSPREIPCPHPFFYDLHTKQCQCQKHSYQKYCRTIRRGKETLMPSQIQCIKKKECRPLDNCDYGSFDMTSYQCPPKIDMSGSGVGQLTNIPGQPRRRGRVRGQH